MTARKLDPPGRLFSYAGAYLCGVATSAIVAFAGVVTPVESREVPGPLPGPSRPSLADGLASSRLGEAPGPAAAVAAVTPHRIPLQTVTFAITDPSVRVEQEPSPFGAAASEPAPSGGVMVFEELRALDREVRASARRERRVAALGAPSRAVSLDAAQIRGVVTRQMPALRRCYERASRRRGFGAEERLRLDLQITRGAVESASVTGASNAQLEQCVEATARRWRFPEGSAQASLPLRLRPEES